MYKVYVLQSESTNELYKGFTQDIEKRIREHNTGKTRSTRNKGEWRLVYYENCKTRIESRGREKYLKSGIGREYLKCVLSLKLELPIEGPIVQGIE